PEFELMTSGELLSDESDGVQQILTSSGMLEETTPLWFYTLKEAAIRGCGEKLGPLGSRIVMETLDAAIQRASPSILADDNRWRPDPRLRPSSPDSYSFTDLIRFAALTTGS